MRWQPPPSPLSPPSVSLSCRLHVERHLDLHGVLVLEHVEAEVWTDVEAGPATRTSRQELGGSVSGLVHVGGHDEHGRAAGGDAQVTSLARLSVDVHRAPHGDGAHACAAVTAGQAGAPNGSTSAAPARRAVALASACWRRYAGNDSAMAVIADSRPMSPVSETYAPAATIDTAIGLPSSSVATWVAGTSMAFGISTESSNS